MAVVLLHLARWIADMVTDMKDGELVRENTRKTFVYLLVFLSGDLFDLQLSWLEEVLLWVYCILSPPLFLGNAHAEYLQAAWFSTLL